MTRKKPILSFTKSGEIYIPSCNEHSVLFPSDVNPEQWPSCNDAYEYTWNLDMGNDIAALSKIDRIKLSKSSGFCPQNRCQLTNLTSTKNDGKCPENLCYTKLENGGRSYGACCFTDGAFNSGNLIGYYNKTQATPKPIYKKSRVILDSIDSNGNDNINNIESYSRFINANLVYPGIIATQCPLENTINDINRMIIEQNIKLWIQLAPLALSNTDDSDPTSQCKYNPNTFINSSYHHKNISINTILNNDNYINFTGNSFLMSNYKIKYEYTDNNIREQSINHIWYKNWRDFDIPDEKDSEDMLKLIDYAISILQHNTYTTTSNSTIIDGSSTSTTTSSSINSNIMISCLSGRGRSGTLSALLIGRMKQITTFAQLVDIIVQLRENRDGMLETPQQFRYIAKLMNLSDPAVCNSYCTIQHHIQENENIRLLLAVITGVILVLIPVLFMLRRVKI